MEPTAELTMENLTKKLTMLLALLSGHRTQTLTKLNIDFMALTSEKCSFIIPDLQGESKKSDECDMYNRNVIPCGV